MLSQQYLTLHRIRESRVKTRKRCKALNRYRALSFGLCETQKRRSELEELLNQPETASEVQEVIADTSGEDISTDESVEAVPVKKIVAGQASDASLQFTVDYDLSAEKKHRQRKPLRTLQLMFPLKLKLHRILRLREAKQPKPEDEIIGLSRPKQPLKKRLVQCSVPQKRKDEPKEELEEEEEKERAAEDDDITESEENAPFGKSFSLSKFPVRASAVLYVLRHKIQKIIGTSRHRAKPSHRGREGGSWGKKPHSKAT
ncbi:hypothetical protein ACROYT_G040160 [Oculina patagonica]